MRVFSLFGIAAFAVASAAQADTAYIEPSNYAPQLGQTITVEAAFNDYCCVPKYAVRSDAYSVILPDGHQIAPDRIEVFSNSTILEQTLQSSGTTRFTTGERLGRTGGEYVLLNGAYHMVNSDEASPIDIPSGTPILSSQTATVSDSYVTIGDPTWDSVHVPIGRLAIHLDQHPSTLKVGDTIDIRVSFDGTLLDQKRLVLTRSGQKERIEDQGRETLSGADGHAQITLNQPGTHVIMTRLQAPAPDDAATDIRSYTTALTFDVGHR